MLGRKIALRGQKFIKKVNFGPKGRPRYSHAVVVPFRSPQASLLNQRQNARRHMPRNRSTFDNIFYECTAIDESVARTAISNDDLQCFRVKFGSRAKHFM